MNQSNKSNMQHQPKGSMCMSCSKLNDDCSNLDFKSMKPFKTISDHTVTVICSGHSKREVK